VPRDIAYLHATHGLIIIDKTQGAAVDQTQNGNHNKHTTQQHVLKAMMEKLPKITLAEDAQTLVF
jgi:hypothetical protein